MRILLPPSETKRDGGAEDSALDLSALGFARLNPLRRTMLAAVRSLCSNRATAAAALRLSRTQYFEVERNRALWRSPVLPAMDRYTGVLYDALDAASLGAQARDFARERVIIHSALFGLVRAGDPIPAYRLSHDSRVPGRPLGTHWKSAIERELGGLSGLVLDLRSEAYVGLGPAGPASQFLRVVTRDADGSHRALNHFNKKGKGEFLRELLLAGIDHVSVESLLTWADGSSFRLERSGPGEFQLVV
ncbi:MAG: peroxide stress protein YaaA [Cryobacterium sp.]|nr:peroxide stress protein YaaA [Cryobacterium sp.]